MKTNVVLNTEEIKSAICKWLEVSHDPSIRAEDGTITFHGSGELLTATVEDVEYND